MIKKSYSKQISLAQVKVKWFQLLLCITNNSIKHQSFDLHIVKWSNSSISIQFSISTQFNCQKHFYFKAVRVFANGPGDLGSIPGRVIPKTQKMVLDASLLNTQHYKVRIKGKVKQSREGVAPSPTPWCSSYRKGSLRVTLDYGRQLYFYLV